ncbi:HAD hydrolase family protein [uncultured Brachyspira sp.]
MVLIKYNTLKWICENKDIDISNIMSFGDNFNDAKMIEYSGYG